jgi:5-methylcytosine-specific restriction endonuclease McrA
VHWNRRYCCDKHRGKAKLQTPKYKAYLELNKLRRRKPREFDTCQLVGCNKSLEEIKGIGIKRKRKFCCDEHSDEAYRVSQIKPRKYYICQLDGCEKSLEAMRSHAEYCCDEHCCKAAKIAWYGTPEYRAYEKARNQSPKRKAWKEIYQQSPEVKARQKAYLKRPEVKARVNAYNQSLEVKAKRKVALPKRRAYRQSSEGQAVIKAYKQRPEVAERERIAHRKRQSKKRELPSTFTVLDWRQCLEHFDQSCAYCQEPFGDTTPHQEHFIPLSLDGSYTPDNIVCACYVCNGSKRNYAPEDWCTHEQYERVVNYLVQQ